jgi:hypothetical protein
MILVSEVCAGVKSCANTMVDFSKLSSSVWLLSEKEKRQ